MGFQATYQYTPWPRRRGGLSLERHPELAPHEQALTVLMCIFTCVHVRVSVSDVYVQVCMCVYVCMHVCRYVCVCVCVGVCVCVCVFVWAGAWQPEAIGRIATSELQSALWIVDIQDGHRISIED